MNKHIVLVLIALVSCTTIHPLQASDSEEVGQRSKKSALAIQDGMQEDLITDSAGSSSPPAQLNLKASIVKDKDSELLARIASLEATLEQLPSSTDRRLSALEEALKTLTPLIKHHAQLLEENPAHRRTQRVGVQIWLPCLLAFAHFAYYQELTTPLAIVSYGISLLYLFWGVIYKADDSFHAVTRTKPLHKK